MRAVIYLRVSTKEQAERGGTEDGFSIPAQREACARFISEAGWEIADEYVDRGESARSADRPALKAMLARIAEERDVDVVVVHKIDRLARNLEDHVAIRSALRRHDVALASVTEKVEETASGRMVEGIHALMAEFYSANLAAEVRKGMGQKAKMGGYPHAAPLGYVNVREVVAGRQVAKIVPDPERAYLVVAAFELYSTGEWTVASLAEEMGMRGLVSRGRANYPSRPLTVSGLAALLSNRAYTGLVTWDGVDYPGLHEPLVDRGTFDKVAGLLASRSVRGTRERRHHHYLKGLLFCGVCNRRLSIQHSKGAYTYFYCLGQKDRRYPTGCREGYVSADCLEAGIEELYRSIEVPESWAAGLREAVAAEVASRSTLVVGESEALSSLRAKLENERLKLMAAYYGQAIDLAVLRIEQDRIARELNQIVSRQESVGSDLTEWQAVMEKALSLATDCARTYRRAGERSRKQLNGAVLERVNVVDGKVAEAQFLHPFDLLFHVPKFEYDDVVEVSGLEPPTPTLRT